MRVAVAQISCAVGDSAANLAKISDYCARAKSAGADLIVFPEMSDTGYVMSIIKTQATPWTSGIVPELLRVARQTQIAIICGVSERDGDVIYNSQVFADARGEILAKYRKTHLFGSEPIAEHECFSPGNQLVACSFSEFRIGLTICYDLRFPEVYRTLSLKERSNVFIISSAWPFPRLEHFQTLATARAIENQCYVITANRVGQDDGVAFCGSSAVIDPYGVHLAGASPDREELLHAEISTARLQTVRSGMKIFDDRRPDLYDRS